MLYRKPTTGGNVGFDPMSWVVTPSRRPATGSPGWAGWSSQARGGYLLSQFRDTT